MIAYIIYDKKDIKRNSSYINWFIDEAKLLDINLILITTEENYKKLELPNFVINRSRNYIVSEYFESKNIKVFNNSFITKVTNNKFLTYKYLKDKDIPLLDTYKLIDEPHFYPCIIKSVDGHGGNEVYYVNNKSDIPPLNKEYIYQTIAPKLGRDLRVFIINNKIITSILRTNNKSFKSNYSLGGDIELFKLRTNDYKIIEDIIDCFEFDYVGIDFLFDENDNLLLNEIEDAVGSRMVSQLTDINIAKLYLNYIKNVG